MPVDPPEPRPEEPDREVDVDAAFAEIVARWEPTSEEPAGHEAVEVAEAPAPIQPSLQELFRPALPDPPADAVAWEDEGHFVPPPPPPLPVVEPRRRWAWTALAGAPILGMLFLILDVTLQGWVALGLVGAFVGGFGYLVATMGSGENRRGDWPGDDGAVL